MEQKKIRVLVVDDSALMRKIISDIINSDPECEVAATARNGEEAVKSTAILRPDVITLDIQMPKLDGISALKYIMSEWPTPVVIVTGLPKFGGEDTLKCLEYGAVDLVIKPDGPISLNFEIKKDELLRKIKAASRVKRSLLNPVFVETCPAGDHRPPPDPQELVKHRASAKHRPVAHLHITCLLYTSPSPRDRQKSRMPSSA